MHSLCLSGPPDMCTKGTLLHRADVFNARENLTTVIKILTHHIHMWSCTTKTNSSTKGTVPVVLILFQSFPCSAGIGVATAPPRCP